jgi:hypothetical protein
MTKIPLNYLLIYAIITVLTAILILWLAKTEKHILLIIAGSSAVAIALFYLFYLPSL